MLLNSVIASCIYHHFSQNGILSMDLLISEATRSRKEPCLESREVDEWLKFNVFPRKSESNPMNEIEPLINLTTLDWLLRIVSLSESPSFDKISCSTFAQLVQLCWKKIKIRRTCMKHSCMKLVWNVEHHSTDRKKRLIY